MNQCIYSFRYYDDLILAGILEPLKEAVNGHMHEDGAQHFVAPLGISSLVKYFSAKTGCQIKFNHHISEITKQNEQWIVSTLSGDSEIFDAVVLTMPTPQVLQLKGTVSEIFGIYIFIYFIDLQFSLES